MKTLVVHWVRFDHFCSLFIFFMDYGLFVWNCQCANSSKFSRTMRCFSKQYKQKILVLLELRISGVKADRVIKGLSFDHSHQIEAKGFSGGICVLWKEFMGISILHICSYVGLCPQPQYFLVHGSVWGVRILGGDKPCGAILEVLRVTILYHG